MVQSTAPKNTSGAKKTTKKRRIVESPSSGEDETRTDQQDNVENVDKNPVSSAAGRKGKQAKDKEKPAPTIGSDAAATFVDRFSVASTALYEAKTAAAQVEKACIDAERDRLALEVRRLELLRQMAIDCGQENNPAFVLQLSNNTRTPSSNLPALGSANAQAAQVTGNAQLQLDYSLMQGSSTSMSDFVQGSSSGMMGNGTFATDTSATMSWSGMNVEGNGWGML